MELSDFLRKIGVAGNRSHRVVDAGNYPEKYLLTLDFNREFAELLSRPKFIARSDYSPFIEQYRDVAEFYNILQKEKMLAGYIKSNGLNKNAIQQFIETYNDIKDLHTDSKVIAKHNSDFIAQRLAEEKQYLNDVLKECDPAILLDDEQREVVLSDEDYTLVVAGAGAGKTTTVAAKVKYLVDRKGVDPK